MDKEREYICNKYNDLCKDGYFVIDTETTSLEGEVVQFSLLNDKKEILINKYVKPLCKISKEATEIHGITNKMVSRSDNFDKVFNEAINFLALNDPENKKPIFIYNERFDLSAMYRSLSVLNYFTNEEKENFFDRLEFRSNCVMETFATFYGEFHEYFQTFTWQKLAFAAQFFDSDFKNIKLHDSKSDCLLTIDVIEGIRKYG